MDGISFGKACQPYNKKYRELFGEVPCPDDYACNREDFLNALIVAVENEKELKHFLKLRSKNTDLNKLY